MSPGLVVMGGDSRSEGCVFESQCRILDGHFFTFICCKIILMFVWKRPKINEKEAGDGPLKKERSQNADHRAIAAVAVAVVVVVAVDGLTFRGAVVQVGFICNMEILTIQPLLTCTHTTSMNCLREKAEFTLAIYLLLSDAVEMNTRYSFLSKW